MLIQIPKDFQLLAHSANWTFGEYYEKAGGKKREDFQKNMECLLTGEGMLKQIARDEHPLPFLHDLLEHLSELSESFATLADCAHLHRSSPKLPKGVTVHRFRKLFYEAFLEELYVFINRIENCVTFLQRAFAHDADMEKVGLLGTEVKRIVKEKFSHLILLRGTHTHKMRLTHMLEEHRRILFLEMFSSTTGDPIVEKLLGTARRQYQQETTQQLHETTMAAKDALLGLTEFLVLYTAQNGLFRVPQKYNKRERKSD